MRKYAFCLLLIGWAVAAFAAAREFETQIAKVNGVQLHYIEKGEGAPVIFIHGGIDDLRYWDNEIDFFARKYKVIAYSRRYNYPNNNPVAENDYSALIDAEDLAALIREKNLQPAHLIGASHGALTALLVAIQNPDLVRSLNLAEPPLMRLLQQTEEGKKAYAVFESKLWAPMSEKFKANNDEEALRIALDYFIGPGGFDGISDASRQYYRSNVKEWRVLTASSSPFPSVAVSDLQAIKQPVLLLLGEDTFDYFKMINKSLESILKQKETAEIPNAGHDMWNENPGKCREATMQFLMQH